jgi:hypothetical protein
VSVVALVGVKAYQGTASNEVLYLRLEIVMRVFNIAEFAVIEVTCEDCGEHEDIVMEKELLERFYAGQATGITREEEELLTTSTHINCWEKMFA